MPWHFLQFILNIYKNITKWICVYFAWMEVHLGHNVYLVYKGTSSIGYKVCIS